jgi:hypothetical protein
MKNKTNFEAIYVELRYKATTTTLSMVLYILPLPSHKHTINISTETFQTHMITCILISLEGQAELESLG